jgi:hypothetical protein
LQLLDRKYFFGKINELFGNFGKIGYFGKFRNFGIFYQTIDFLQAKD